MEPRKDRGSEPRGPEQIDPMEIELMKLDWRQRPEPRVSGMVAWICGVAAGGLVAIAGFLTASPPDPFVLRDLPFRLEFVLFAAALAAAVPARMLGAAWWQGLLLGLAFALLTLAGVEFVFLVGPAPPMAPSLPALRELATAFAGILVAATAGASLAQRLGGCGGRR